MTSKRSTPTAPPRKFPLTWVLRLAVSGLVMVATTAFVPWIRPRLLIEKLPAASRSAMRPLILTAELAGAVT